MKVIGDRIAQLEKELTSFKNAIKQALEGNRMSAVADLALQATKVQTELQTYKIALVLFKGETN